jgi:hypothetical protein
MNNLKVMKLALGALLYSGAYCLPGLKRKAIKSLRAAIKEAQQKG